MPVTHFESALPQTSLSYLPSATSTSCSVALLTFQLSSGDQANQIWHSLTSCKASCNKSTGISYPIPDGEFQFDSGQLGLGGAPTVNRGTWSTPRNMPVGTHTFFCRIHPLMRGAVRVVRPD